MEPDHSRMHLIATGREPDEALQQLAPLYEGNKWRCRATEQPYSYQYAGIGDETMSLRTSRMQGRISGEIPPGGDLVVQWITRGDATIRTSADHLRMQVGRPTLFPAERAFTFDYADYDQKIVHLSRPLVEQLAREQRPGSTGPLLFDHRHTPTRTASALWFDTVSFAARTLERGAVNELLRHELARMTMLAFLELYPAEEVVEPTSRTSGERATGLVRAFTDFVDAHAHLPLTATEIAVAVGLPLRTLQDTVSRHLGSTPMGYLRQVRLERVRLDLRSATGSSSTIADIAHRWGFVHLGRFAIEYQRRYDEKPSETLRRSDRLTSQSLK